MSVNINDLASNEIYHKLNFCLQNNLISFIRRSNQQEIVITVDIMPELKKIELENIASLKDVGLLLNIPYVNKKFNGKKMRVLEGSLTTLVNFLDSKIV